MGRQPRCLFNSARARARVCVCVCVKPVFDCVTAVQDISDKPSLAAAQFQHCLGNAATIRNFIETINIYTFTSMSMFTIVNNSIFMRISIFINLVIISVSKTTIRPLSCWSPRPNQSHRSLHQQRAYSRGSHRKQRRQGRLQHHILPAPPRQRILCCRRRQQRSGHSVSLRGACGGITRCWSFTVRLGNTDLGWGGRGVVFVSLRVVWS